MSDLVQYICHYYFLLIISGTLLLIAGKNGMPRGKQARRMVLAAGIMLALSVLSAVDMKEMWSRWTQSTISYSAQMSLFLLLNRIIFPKTKWTRLLHWVCVLPILLVLTSPFHHLMYTFVYLQDYQVVYVRGPLYWIYVFAGVLCWAIYGIQAWSLREERGRYYTVLILYMAATVLIAGILEMYSDSSWLMLDTIAVIIPLYFTYQYYLDAEKKLQVREKLLKEKRQELTLSQIRPHFLFNTLAAIRYLITEDPAMAVDSLEQFAEYLRHDLSAAELQEPIPVERELHHAENYAEIEMLRFPDLDVEFVQKDGGYMVPTLTVQPLVENAIRHGVSGKKNGYVRVEAIRCGNYHVIGVSDNGKGFDTEKTEYHNGLKIVRERLEEMTGGELEVSSIIGQGTTCIIRIPAGKEEEVSASR